MNTPQDIRDQEVGERPFPERYPHTWAALKWLGNAIVFGVILIAYGIHQRNVGYREGVTGVIGAFDRATTAMVKEGERDRAAGNVRQSLGD
jgi:hypothetical protein